MKAIPKIVAWLGAFLLLGTAGACDAGNIGLGQTIVQLFVGVALLGCGILMQEVERRENENADIGRADRRG